MGIPVYQHQTERIVVGRCKPGERALADNLGTGKVGRVGESRRIWPASPDVSQTGSMH